MHRCTLDGDQQPMTRRYLARLCGRTHAGRCNLGSHRSLQPSPRAHQAWRASQRAHLHLSAAISGKSAQEHVYSVITKSNLRAWWLTNSLSQLWADQCDFGNKCESMQRNAGACPTRDYRGGWSSSYHTAAFFDALYHFLSNVVQRGRVERHGRGQALKLDIFLAYGVGPAFDWSVGRDVMRAASPVSTLAWVIRVVCVVGLRFLIARCRTERGRRYRSCTSWLRFRPCAPPPLTR